MLFDWEVNVGTAVNLKVNVPGILRRKGVDGVAMQNPSLRAYFMPCT
jgi:hypothetical protein